MDTRSVATTESSPSNKPVNKPAQAPKISVSKNRFETLSDLRRFLSDNHLDDAASQKISRDYSAFTIATSTFEVKPSNKYNHVDEHTFTDKAIAQAIENLFTGIKHLIAWTLMQWDKGETPWVIGYAHQLPVIAHKVLKKISEMGLPGSKMLNMADPNIGIGSEQMVHQHKHFNDYFKKKKGSLSGDTIPKGFSFDKNTQIIIPFCHGHMGFDYSSYSHKLQLIIEDFLYIFSLQKEAVLTAENIVVFFGMFDAERMLDDGGSLRYKSFVESCEEREKEALSLISEQPVKIARFSETQATEYYQSAEQLLNLILVENFHEYKNKLKADVCSYLSICHGSEFQVNAVVKKPQPSKLSEVKTVSPDGEPEVEEEKNIVISITPASNETGTSSNSAVSEETPEDKTESATTIATSPAKNITYTTQERINAYLNHPRITPISGHILNSMFDFTIANNLDSIQLERLSRLAERVAEKHLLRKP
jgi:hypothetical protein